MELGLGTVQFGLDYGVSNQQGRPPDHEIGRILQLAKDSGVRVLDTAPAYGEAEELLGRCPHLKDSFRVVTKTLPLGESRGTLDAPRRVREGFERSLERLRLPAVDGLLVHHATDLLGPGGEEIFDVLDRLRRDGLARKIGLSVYNGMDIDAALARYDFDLIQVPMNVLDQRLVRDGQLVRLTAKGVEIHVRSVFLQGLLLMDPATAPAYFEPIRSQLTAWRFTLEERGLTPIQGALAYIRSLQGVSVVLVGVDNGAQLASNIADFAMADISGLDFAPFALDDERFLNPGKWELG